MFFKKIISSLIPTPWFSFGETPVSPSQNTQLLGERDSFDLNSKEDNLSGILEVILVWPIRESYSSGQDNCYRDGLINQDRLIWVNKTHSGLKKKKAIGNKHTLSTDMAERNITLEKYNLGAAPSYLAIMNISSAWRWDNTEESIVQRWIKFESWGYHWPPVDLSVSEARIGPKFPVTRANKLSFSLN